MGFQGYEQAAANEADNQLMPNKIQRRTTALAAAISLFPLGQPLLLGTIGITTATTAVVLHAPAAAAQDSSSVAEIAKAITVRIEGATQGSGVLVKKENDEYTILTAWHVLEPNSSDEGIDVITSDGIVHNSSRLKAARIGRLDLGLITFKSPRKYKPAKRSGLEKIKSREIITLNGYPNSSSLKLKSSIGNVIANAEVGVDQGYQLLYNNFSEPGISGGSILDSEGRLIGIHGRGELDLKTFSKTGEIKKTNINQGIPVYFYNLHENGKPLNSGKTNPTTWEDYLALYYSLDKKNPEDTKSEIQENLKQTATKFVSQMIKLRPKHIMAYALMSELSLNGDEKANAKFKSQAISLILEYQQLRKLILSEMEAGRPKEVIRQLNLAEQYVSDISAENMILKAKSLAMLGDTDAGIKLGEQALLLARELRSQNTKPFFSEKLSAEESIAFINYSLGNMYMLTSKWSSADGYLKRAELWLLFNTLTGNPQQLSLMRGISEQRLISAVFGTNDKDIICPSYLKALHYKSNIPKEFQDLSVKCNTFLKSLLHEWVGSSHDDFLTDYQHLLNIKLVSAQDYVNRAVWRQEAAFDTGAAIVDLTAAISLKHDNLPMLYNIRGDFKTKLGDYRGAIADYTVSLQKSNSHESIASYTGRGSAHALLGEYDNAIVEFTKATKIDPSNAFIYQLRSAARLYNGDKTGARQDIDKARSIDPTIQSQD